MPPESLPPFLEGTMTNAPDAARHLDLITAPALAGALGVSTYTLKRARLPRPVHVGNRRMWFRAEITPFLPAPSPYTDAIQGNELAALLGCSVNSLYRFVKDGTIPKGRRVGRKSFWSRRAVEQHLRALPRR